MAPAQDSGMDWAPVIIAIIGAVVASIVSPTVQWAIQKKRSQMEHRAALIAGWRRIADHQEFSRFVLMRDPLWGALEPLLTAAELKALRASSNEIHLIMGSPIDADLMVFQRAIARIEQEWDLI